MNNEEKAERLATDFRVLCMRHMASFTALEFGALLLALTSKLIFDTSQDEELAREVIGVCVKEGHYAHKLTDEPTIINKVLIKLFDELVEGE